MYVCMHVFMCVRARYTGHDEDGDEKVPGLEQVKIERGVQPLTLGIELSSSTFDQTMPKNPMSLTRAGSQT